MPEAIFLSIRRRPADEARASTRGYVVGRDGLHIASLPGAASVADAVRVIEQRRSEVGV